MSQWLEAKYVSMVGTQLRNFKKKSTSSWSFSCPICGDSKTNKHKARGYVFKAKTGLMYHCHNCGVSLNIPVFLKRVDQGLYDQFIRERFQIEREGVEAKDKTEHDEFVKKLTTPEYVKTTPLRSVKKISKLDPNHPVKRYVEGRAIPPEYHHKLFLAMRFKEFTNSFLPGKFESLENDEPRLIIPFLDKEGRLFGFQGRSLRRQSTLRYITIMLKDRPKMFGLDTYDPSKHSYVVEGPIDSMFLPNAIAAAGGDVITDLPTINTDKRAFTIVYDNEPRNTETIEKMAKAIKAGYPVCIWPENMKQKDINLMILAGITSEKLVDIIEENTYTGLEAELKLAERKKT